MTKTNETTEERLKYYQEFYNYNLTHTDNGIGINNLVTPVIEQLKTKLRKEKIQKLNDTREE